MRIAICCHPKYGGSGVVASELALALAAGDDEIHVLSSSPPPRLEAVPAEAGIARERAGAGRIELHRVTGLEHPLFERPLLTLALVGRLVELGRARALDVIHAHYAVPHAAAAVLARQILGESAPAVVVTCHGTDVSPVGNHPAYADSTRFALAEADAVTAVSESLRRRVADELGVSRPVEVIPNLVDPGRFRPGAERRPPDDVATVVHVSNFRPVKRSLDVIDVFAGIRRQLRARLVMVGDGPDRSAAEERCRELGLAGEVRFTGNVTRVESVLAGADLLLLPSEAESFGVAALEAMACEVPVVASEVGGVPEVVAQGETGLLFARGDVGGMVAASVRILSQPELGHRLGRNGRRRVLERFTPEVVVPRYRDLYRRCVEQRRRETAEGSRRSYLRLVRR
jgi:N-acetyl-alpha-D-glucosaminyl L-malate synthase BshA